MNNPEPCFIGLDVGTSGLKALAVDARGRVLDQAFRGYGLDCPRPLWAEQSPEEWCRAAVEALAELSARLAGKGAPAGLGLTGQMHGSVFLDREDRVIRPAILWCDQRTGPETAALESAIGREALVRVTGNPAFTGFTAPKITWLREHEPDNFARLRRLLLPKDFVRLRLAGLFASEVTDNSGTSLFDIRKRAWSAEIIAALGFRPEWFAPPLESCAPAGRLTREAARLTGLPEGLPVAAGAGDQAASGLGNGVVAPGIVSTTLGSSGVVFAFSADPATDPAGRIHTMCHAVPGAWHLMGVTLSAGASFQWFSENFPNPEAAGAEDPRAGVEASAATAPPGSAGLVFLPYLAGERTPHANPLARGAFIGVTGRHGHAHFSRSVLEGVACALRDSLEIVTATAGPAADLRLAGGGARSETWRRILAGVFRSRLTLMQSHDSTALGAAILAAVAAGRFRSVPEACSSMVRPGATVEPDPETGAVYENLYRVFRALYPACAPYFDALVSIEV